MQSTHRLEQMAATQLPWRTSLRTSLAVVSSNTRFSPSAWQVPIICTKEGLWTEEFKLCESLRGTCPPPPELNFVEYKCEQGHGIGEGKWKLNRKLNLILIQPS